MEIEKLRHLSCIFLFFLLHYGCNTTGHVYLSNMSIPNVHKSIKTDAHQEKWLIHIADIRDERLNKQNLGQAAGHPVFVSNMTEWLVSGLKALEDKGYIITFLIVKYIHSMFEKLIWS